MGGHEGGLVRFVDGVVERTPRQIWCCRDPASQDTSVSLEIPVHVLVSGYEIK